MIDMVSLLSAGAAFFVVAAAPGPATLSNAVVAMSKGRSAGLVYGSGLTCGLALWGVVAASGLGAILQTSAQLLVALKVLGALYLFWLAFQSARSALHPGEKPGVTLRDENWFMRGLILNASNPKAVVAWMATLSIGVDSTANTQTLAITTGLCIAIGALVYVLYSLAFSLGGVMRVYTRARRGINGLMAGLFTLFGLGLLRSAFSR